MKTIKSYFLLFPIQTFIQPNLVILSDFSQFLSMLDLGTLGPLPSALSHLFIGNEWTWLICSLPRRAGYFNPKLYGGPGKPEASLGKPGVRKSFKMTLLPSLLGIFRIPYQNVKKPFVLRDNWCQAAQFDQQESKLQQMIVSG